MTTVTPEAANRPEVMKTELTENQRAARARVYALPLDKLDPAAIEYYENEEMFWKFERLRAEDPVHYTADEDSEFGAYWSITKWDDIIKIDTDSVTYSNEAGIAIASQRKDRDLAGYQVEGAEDNRTPEQIEADKARGIQSLLSMDLLQHVLHRGAVS